MARCDSCRDAVDGLLPEVARPEVCREACRDATWAHHSQHVNCARLAIIDRLIPMCSGQQRASAAQELQPAHVVQSTHSDVRAMMISSPPQYRA